MNLSRVEIITGTATEVAYRYVTVAEDEGDPSVGLDGDRVVGLEVYVGAALATAPPDCSRAVIAEGFTRWMLGDTAPCDEHQSEDLCWQLEGKTRETAVLAFTTIAENEPLSPSDAPAPAAFCGLPCCEGNTCIRPAGHDGFDHARPGHECLNCEMPF